MIARIARSLMNTQIIYRDFNMHVSTYSKALPQTKYLDGYVGWQPEKKTPLAAGVV